MSQDNVRDSGSGGWQSRLRSRSRNSSFSDPIETVPISAAQRHGCNNRFTGGGRDVNANLSDISPNYDTLSLDVGRRAEDMSSPKLAVSSILAIPTGLASSPGPSSSFLSCVVCGLTPPGPPLHGCDSGHLVCAACRDMGGALLSCPRCGSGNLNIRQTVAEELLMTELDRNRLVFCPYKSVGCNKITRSQLMSQHRDACLFRPVKCPKGMFSLSCTYIGPLCTIQQHARDKHSLHQGVTTLQPGLISSKMFDKSPDRTCCDDKSNAKFQPLELTHNEDLFYCYFERVVDRRLWFFFIRMFGTEEQAKKFQGSIMIGHSALDRGDHASAGVRYLGPVASYKMRKEEIRNKGLILAVPDEFLKSCKVGNVLFRVWFQVKEIG